MDREVSIPRYDWPSRVESIGFRFHSLAGRYWDESARYRLLPSDETALLEATRDLHELCLQAVDHVVALGRYAELGIPAWFTPAVEASWRNREPSIYGRFDLCYRSGEAPKLLEYNADTPTSLLEASLVQRDWRDTVLPDAGQCNRLHQLLVQAWRAQRGPVGEVLHLVHQRGSLEDEDTVLYVGRVAAEAGYDVRVLPIESLGWCEIRRRFVDEDDRVVRRLFKLYPWEWLVADPFGEHVPTVPMVWHEPAWKMVLSNKGILAILWELFPNHPNLLPAYFDSQPLGRDFVAKPLLGREGANVQVHRDGEVFHTPGIYGGEGYVYQALADLPMWGQTRAVIGSWVVGDTPAGLGFREDEVLVTCNTSRFVPHYVEQTEER